MIENKHARLLVETGVLAALITLTVIYHEYVAGMSRGELTLIAISAVLIILLVAASVSWIYSQPQKLLEGVGKSFADFKREGAILHTEFRSLLTQTLDRQPFVSEDVLAIIEQSADNIWVVTTDLKNDVSHGRIRDSVEDNLKKGKHYTYFLPSAKDPNFPNAAQNERSYKNWTVYKERSAQITFIHLPHDTLFLFREVVIYNPIVNADSKAEYETAAKGFTYFDTSPDTRDKLMQIPDTYLEFLKGQLHRYSESVGLTTEVEQLLKDLEGRLADPDTIYLAKLIGKRRIEDFAKFGSFIESVRRRDTSTADLLFNTLKRYTDQDMS